jgi:hypothetical protein
MGLPQLIGLRCVGCRKEISSITEGGFCPACGNPVHRDCQQPDGAPAGDGRCAACGGDTADPVAVEVRAVRAREAAKPAAPPGQATAGASAAPSSTAAEGPDLPALTRADFVGYGGCLVVIVGTLLPLIWVSAGPEGTSEFRAGPNAWAIGLGNVLLAFAAMGAVFIGLKNSHGTLAAGLGLVALTVPLLWQIELLDASDLAQITTVQRTGPWRFGWLAWFVLLAGAGLVVMSGVLQLRTKPDPAAGKETAVP